MKVIFFFCFLISSIEAFPQYAWDIGYIPIDSINSKDIGKEVKIDFDNMRNSYKGKSYRYFLSGKDTGIIVVNSNNIQVVERRKIGVDWGLYELQYIESIDQIESGTSLRITSSTIKDVRKDSILFSSHAEKYKRIKKNKYLKVEDKVYDIWIERKKLMGVMFKRN